MDKNLDEFCINNKFKLSENILRFVKLMNENFVFCSHNPKLINPDIPNNKVIWNDNLPKIDGYVYSGTINNKKKDMSVNAAFSKFIKLLFLELEDGINVYEHLINESSLSKKEFENLEVPYKEIVQATKSIKFGYSDTHSDRRLKQVFFPVEGSDYHILSIIPECNSIYQVKHYYNEITFSEEVKKAKEKRRNKEFCDIEIKNIPDLISIKYGGTKSQNISYLNAQEGGFSYLLPSFPPSIEKRNYYYPKYDFIKENLVYKKVSTIVRKIIKFINIDYNNKNLRIYRDSLLLDFLDIAILEIYKLRDTNIGWSDKDSFNNLSKNQKILLDDKYQAERNIDNSYYIEFCDKYASFISLEIQKQSKKNEIIIPDWNRDYIYKLFIKEGAGLV